MAKKVASVRINEEWLEWLDATAQHMHVTKSSLLEDALAHAATTINAAAKNTGTLLHELAGRYGEDAEMLVWVEEVEGRAEARVRINGEEPPDVRGHVVVDPSGSLAHVFVEVTGDWRGDLAGGTYHIGRQVLSTFPIRPLASLPWPPDPAQRSAAFQTIGEIIRGGAKAPERVEA